MSDAAPAAASRASRLPLAGMVLPVVSAKNVRINDGGVASDRRLAALNVGLLPAAVLDCLSQPGRPDGSSSYPRLFTRLVRQDLAATPTDPAARERRRRHVVAGAYTLRSCPNPAITVVGVGAMITEVLQAADRLAGAELPAEVVCVTSPVRLFDTDSIVRAALDLAT